MHNLSPKSDLLIQVASELNRRIDARNDFLSFVRYTYPDYKPDAVHQLIASHFGKIASGEIKRLMIFAPPQHGKSELASVRFPAYWLAKRPDDPVAIASYAAELAESKSRQVRDIIESPEYQVLFGETSGRETRIKTRSDSRAVNHWSLAHSRGALWAGGVGGSIVGFGFRLGIIDDPFKNWEEAQSQNQRDKVWDWYKASFRTRIWENGAIVLIMTRWHENDLAGRLLQSQGDEWTVLRLPAMAETQEERDKNNKYLGLSEGKPDPLGRAPDEPLSPRRFSRVALEELKRDVGSVVWASQYQGVPRPLEGSRFKRAWFEIVGAAPRNAKRIRYWDKAGTQGGDGAYTAGVLVALSTDGVIYIEDVVRGRWSALERETIIKQTAELDRTRYGNTVKIYVEQEPGSGGKESAEATIRKLVGFSVYKDPPVQNKDARLEPFAAQAEALNVKLVRGDWNHDYIEEFVALPNGKRDQSDATAGSFNKLSAPTKATTFGQIKTRR